MHTRNQIIVLISIGVCLVLFYGAFSYFNNYIYSEKQANPEETYEPYRATLTGEYLCLPHKDTAGPTTLECAFGIRTDVGEYYAIDFALMSEIPTEIKMGDRITASGVATPVERLSSDHWKIYPIAGIFSVTDSISIVE